MVVFKSATVAFPISLEELLSIVVGPHPSGARIRWSSPISFVPLVASAHRIPITINPNVVGAWTYRPNPHDPGSRRRPYSDS
jgi:hypothetical protein